MFYLRVCWVCLCTTCMSGAHVGQKRVLDSLLDSLELEYTQLLATSGCWELNLGHLKEQTMFLTAEPSLWPQEYNFSFKKKLSIFNF